MSNILIGEQSIINTTHKLDLDRRSQIRVSAPEALTQGQAELQRYVHKTSKHQHVQQVKCPLDTRLDWLITCEHFFTCQLKEKDEDEKKNAKQKHLKEEPRTAGRNDI